MFVSARSLIVSAAITGLLASSIGPAQAQRGRFKQRMLERRAAAGAQREPRAALPAGVQVERDIAYGSDPNQRMDVYRPAHAQNAPVIFMVHGGGWRRGDKDAAGVVDNKVAHWVPKGYVVVSVGYRLVPQVTPLQEADDIARALAFAQGRAKTWGAAPSHFVLMGHSAGAHLVSLVSADPAYAARHGSAPWLGTVSLDSGAYNVVEIMQARHFSLYDEAFGQDRALWAEASPTLRLTHAPVPMLLVCGSQRAESCAQANAFAQRARSLGGSVSVAPIALRHGSINADLGEDNSLTAQVDAFLRTLDLP